MSKLLCISLYSCNGKETSTFSLEVLWVRGNIVLLVSNLVQGSKAYLFISFKVRLQVRLKLSECCVLACVCAFCISNFRREKNSCKSDGAGVIQVVEGCHCIDLS